MERHGTDAHTPGGHTVSAFDNYGRPVVTNTIGNQGTVVQEAAYDFFGRRLGSTQPHTAGTTPVAKVTYAYDEFDRVLSVTVPIRRTVS